MRGWEPDAPASRADRLALARMVFQGPLEIIEQALPLRAAWAERCLRTLWELDARDAPGVLHPDFFNWYFGFGDAVRADDFPGFEHFVDSLDEVVRLVRQSRRRARKHESLLGVPLEFGLPNASALPTLARLQSAAAHAAEESGEHLRGSTRNFSAVLRPRVAESFRLAFDLLERTWPAMHAEILEYVQRIVVVDSDDIIGASDSSSLGTIYIGAGEVADPVKLAEEIVHESSHNVLNTLAFLQPLCLNGADERFGSPLRKDPRPIFGIFHQVFVLARLTEWYRRILPLYPERGPHSADISVRFRGGVRVLNEHARLTSIGAELLRSINHYSDGHNPCQEVFHAKVEDSPDPALP